MAKKSRNSQLLAANTIKLADLVAEIVKVRVGEKREPQRGYRFKEHTEKDENHEGTKGTKRRKDHHRTQRTKKRR